MSKTDLAKRVEQKAEARAAGVQRTMDEWLTTYSDDFAAALPQMVDKDRFIRLALNELRWNPGLRDCDVASVIGAMMTAAQLGLEPSGPLNHVYLTPRNQNIGDKQNPQWVKRVQFTIGYQGYIELAMRTGAVKSITADIVYANDEFRLWVEDGRQRILHKPVVFGDKGAPVGAYAMASMVNGDVMVRAVDLEEIDRAKQASDAGRKNVGPWVTDWEAMARKTAVRRLWKWLPKSAEAAAAYNVDGRTVTDRPDLPIIEESSAPVLDVVSDVEVVDEGETETGTDGGDVEEEDPTRPFESEEADDA